MAKVNFNITGKIGNSIFGSSIKTKKFVQTKYINNEQSEEYGNLIIELVDKSIRMMERKHTQKIEDLHNDNFTDWLRDKGYQVSDQTRSGKSLKTSGELDIMIRKENGTPVSIIEAFRLSSCGKDNVIVSKHLNKLLYNYDTAGHKNNFILIYAESPKYYDLWIKYLEYVQKIESEDGRDNNYKLLSFYDTKELFSKVTDVRVGEAIHEREGKKIHVFHIFINMFIK